jgi:hypothetical protein
MNVNRRHGRKSKFTFERQEGNMEKLLGKIKKNFYLMNNTSTSSPLILGLKLKILLLFARGGICWF